jgi:diguanylate cyclase (GGDEF)-like protein/PAS domain S-box-containing protein
MLAISVVMSVVAALLIIRLHIIAGNYIREQITLEQIQTRVFQLDDLDKLARAENHVTSFAQDQTWNSKKAVYQSLNNLSGDYAFQEDAVTIRLAFHRYEIALSEEYSYVNALDESAEREHHDNVLTPAFEHLTQQLDGVHSQRRRFGMIMNAVADIGTFALLLIASLSTTLLVWRYVNARRDNAQLVVEQEVYRIDHERFDVLAQNSKGISFITNTDGLIAYATSASEKILYLNNTDLIGENFFGLLEEGQSQRLHSIFSRVLEADGASASTELRLRSKNGEWVSTETVITNMVEDSRIQGILITSRDITERKAFERQLAHQAFHDPLTTLPNRALFTERLQHALTKSKRTKATVAVLFIDLDNFKLVNDSLGHEAGDELLIDVSKRLQRCTRPSDTVARLAGDEFTVLLEDVQDDDGVFDIAKRIVEILQLPACIDGRDVFTTGSVGVAISKGDYDSPDDLLRDADTAMYQAKSRGKSDCATFEQSMNRRAVERLELESDIRKGIRENQFFLHYQPIFSVQTGNLLELEALLRWNHPTKGLVYPDDFIPVAEDTGLIIPLGKFVLEEACKQARIFKESIPGLSNLRIAVNLSARQLAQPDLVELITKSLDENGLPASCLKLEITESVMMRDTETSIPKLQELKRLGVHLAIDDFGTGYSSMAYIRTLPIDALKIDRSFVTHVSDNEDDRAIVMAIVSLGKTLELEITSEGIETAEQLKALQDMGCDEGQGFHLGRPALPADIASVLSKLSSQNSIGGEFRPISIKPKKNAA